MVLGGRHAAGSIEKLGDGVVFAFAGMFELVGEIVLVLRIACQPGNAALKIVDLHPAMGPCDANIGNGGVGGFPISRAANLQHILESVEIDGAARV